MQPLCRATNFADKRRTITVELPDYDLAVTLRALSSGQIREMRKDKSEDWMRILALMIIDPTTGQRVYQTEDDLKALDEMPQDMTVKLMEAVPDLNGTSKEAIEEAAKNLQASQNDDSASVSLAS